MEAWQDLGDKMVLVDQVQVAGPTVKLQVRTAQNWPCRLAEFIAALSAEFLYFLGIVGRIACITSARFISFSSQSSETNQRFAASWFRKLERIMSST